MTGPSADMTTDLMWLYRSSGTDQYRDRISYTYFHWVNRPTVQTRLQTFIASECRSSRPWHCKSRPATKKAYSWRKVKRPTGQNRRNL